MLLLGKTKKVFKLISRKSCDIQDSFEEVKSDGGEITIYYTTTSYGVIRCHPPGISPTIHAKLSRGVAKG